MARSYSSGGYGGSNPSRLCPECREHYILSRSGAVRCGHCRAKRNAPNALAARLRNQCQYGKVFGPTDAYCGRSGKPMMLDKVVVRVCLAHRPDLKLRVPPTPLPVGCPDCGRTDGYHEMACDLNVFFSEA